MFFIQNMVLLSIVEYSFCIFRQDFSVNPCINGREQHKTDVLDARKPRRIDKTRFWRDPRRRLDRITQCAGRYGGKGNGRDVAWTPPDWAHSLPLRPRQFNLARCKQAEHEELIAEFELMGLDSEYRFSSPLSAARQSRSSNIRLTDGRRRHTMAWSDRPRGELHQSARRS